MKQIKYNSPSEDILHSNLILLSISLIAVGVFGLNVYTAYELNRERRNRTQSSQLENKIEGEKSNNTFKMTITYKGKQYHFKEDEKGDIAPYKVLTAEEPSSK